MDVCKNYMMHDDGVSRCILDNIILRYIGLRVKVLRRTSFFLYASRETDIVMQSIKIGSIIYDYSRLHNNTSNRRSAVQCYRARPLCA